MILTIEPGLDVSEEDTGVRIEDTVLRTCPLAIVGYGQVEADFESDILAYRLNPPTPTAFEIVSDPDADGAKKLKVAWQLPPVGRATSACSTSDRMGDLMSACGPNRCRIRRRFLSKSATAPHEARPDHAPSRRWGPVRSGTAAGWLDC